MNTAVGDEGGYAPTWVPTLKLWLLSLKLLKLLVMNWQRHHSGDGLRSF
ncbi:hypothetical protein ACVXHA_25350 [Escherichia coli]